MFTGIIEEVGRVVEGGVGLAVASTKVGRGLQAGESVAVNGVCLTVVDCMPNGDGGRAVVRFDLSPETVAKTSLGRLGDGVPVNLERPVSLIARLGGHLVQGHVDGVVEVVGRDDRSGGTDLHVSISPDLERYVVLKGSVALDGISLTVADRRPGGFSVSLVPFTLEATTLGAARAGDWLNVEVDVLAKYVESLLGARR